jgi:parvulin-like peptidyl-prolyl isomerase
MLVQMMRTNQRWVMIILVLLMSISLIWFFSNRTQVDRMGSDKVGSIYGRSLTTLELERTMREIQTAADLQLGNIIDPVIVEGNNRTSIAVNHLVMIHQAQTMGIVPSDDEIMEAEKKLSVFQGPDGAFDSSKYAEFVGDKLSPRGLTETELDDLVRRNLQFGKLRDIVTAPVCVSPLELRTVYEQSYTKTDVSVIRFPVADLAAGVTPTEAEIKKYYDDQTAQEGLQQPEKRQIEYVRFSLDAAQKKLQGKPRTEALQPLADAAQSFLEKLLDAKGKDGFANLAAAEKLPVTTTVAFEQNQRAGLPEAAIPRFTAAAFRLSDRDPDSDVPLETGDGYYILHLAKVEPERPLTLEEARPKIIAALKDERARTALAAKAQEVRTKIADALKAGRTFGEAAQAAGQTAQDIPAFSAMAPPAAQPNGQDISAASMELGNGELSKFVPTHDGGLLVYVRGREPIDEKIFHEQTDKLLAQTSQQKRNFYFYEWLKASRDAAQLRLTTVLPPSDEG